MTLLSCTFLWSVYVIFILFFKYFGAVISSVIFFFFSFWMNRHASTSLSSCYTWISPPLDNKRLFYSILPPISDLMWSHPVHVNTLLWKAGLEIGLPKTKKRNIFSKPWHVWTKPNGCLVYLYRKGLSCLSFSLFVTVDSPKIINKKHRLFKSHQSSTLKISPSSSMFNSTLIIDRPKTTRTMTLIFLIAQLSMSGEVHPFTSLHARQPTAHVWLCARMKRRRFLHVFFLFLFLNQRADADLDVNPSDCSVLITRPHRSMRPYSIHIWYALGRRGGVALNEREKNKTFPFGINLVS